MIQLHSFKPFRVPVICAIGAAKSFGEFPIEGWRDIRPIKGAKPTDQFIAAPVCGDSLQGVGIRDGDWVILKLTFDAHEITPGRLVAVFTPAGMLLKHVYFTLDKRVRLVSANPAFPDLVFDADEVIVQGIVVRRERDYS